MDAPKTVFICCPHCQKSIQIAVQDDDPDAIAYVECLPPHLSNPIQDGGCGRTFECHNYLKMRIEAITPPEIEAVPDDPEN